MANAITLMQRYEAKFVLTREQLAYFLSAIKGRMELDQYDRTSILSLYYDTPDYRLIRTSLEKPEFKEKIRLRSYGLASKESPVYLELKRKSKGYVYKRRVVSKLPDIEAFFKRQRTLCAEGQVAREISYFRDYYGNLVPACLIIVDREAYAEIDGNTRLTIDYSPRYRVKDFELDSGDGTPLLEEGKVIVEVKVEGAIPLWLSKALDGGRIYKCSCSKYGLAYIDQLKKVRSLGRR